MFPRLRSMCLLASLGQALGAQEPDFKPILEILNSPVRAASNVWSTREKQPVSVTTISRAQVELSGARTLNDLLSLHVPGFFKVEDQDDTIAGFRGLAADNNSKVMFLLNGQALNAEWFWGPPDALLNGIALGYIDHIDVIRGPGSVTLGQGALLGVINVVTRTGVFNGTALAASGGEHNYFGTSLELGTLRDSLKGYLYFSRDGTQGQELRGKGWGLRSQDGSIGGTLRSAGNRIDRTYSQLFTGRLEHKDWSVDLLYVDQTRDLYNFFRDRNQVEQALFSIGGSHRWAFTPTLRGEARLSFQEDDYLLHSHTGFLLGGVREDRVQGSFILQGEFRDLRMAFGTEYKRFDMGRKDRNGNNFLVNVIDSSLLEAPNEKRHWVYPAAISLYALFGEAYWSFSPSGDLFAAFRYDHHPYWGTYISPRIGVLWNPADLWRARLSYQTGFRGAPGVHYSGGYQGDGLLRSDNYGLVAAATQGRIANIPSVEPERMRSLEAELTYDPTPSLQINAVAFLNRVSKIISFDAFGDWNVPQVPERIGSDGKGDWNGYWYFKNTPGEMDVLGLEACVVLHAGDWSLTTSHAWSSVAKAAPGSIGTLYLVPEERGRHFKAYPENITRLHLVWRPLAPLTLALTGVEYYRWKSSVKSMPGNTLLNLSANYRIRPNWSLGFSAANLLNQTQPYPLTAAASADEERKGLIGSPAPAGRTWWLQTRLTF